MKLAIMQPYFMPYLGYFQLINAADRFVLYDDVNFIKGGWINRNNILLNNKKHLFTIPLADSSAYKKINETEITPRGNWKEKLFKTLETAYKKAPQYQTVAPLLYTILNTGNSTIATLNRTAIETVCNYLDITTVIVPGSTVYNNQQMQSEERVLDICKKEHADVYINATGGKKLYSEAHFAANGIQLRFISMNNIRYRQYNNEHFIENLSIIDVMMFNDKFAIQELLNACTLA